jgi:magnesium chelatase family protein
LLDRFDLRVAVQRPSVDDLLDPAGGEPSALAAARVAAARSLALDRGGRLNADLHGELLDLHAPLTPAALALLRTEMERGRLTGRGYHRIRRVARTIADLAAVGAHAGPASDEVDVEHVEVALSLRTRVRAAAPGLVAC